MVLSNLEKHQSMQAAGYLRDRIAQCQAAESLRKEPLRSMQALHLKDLLAQTKSIWSIFPLDLKLRLCDAKSEELLRSLAKFHGNEPIPGKMTQRCQAMQEIAQHIVLSGLACDEFDPRVPSLDVVFTDFLKELTAAIEERDRNNNSEDVMGIENLMAAQNAASHGEVAVFTPSLQKCADFAKDGLYHLSVSVCITVLLDW